MEAETTNDELTETELRNAGASATYIAYYKAAQRLGETTPSTNHAEMVVEEETELSGGGFHDSLWNASPRFSNNDTNPYGADERNQRILAEAGVYPYA